MTSHRSPHFKVGQPVRIASRLEGTKTDRKYTIAFSMTKMAGNIYSIYQIDDPARIRIKNPFREHGGRDTYVFHPEDVSPVSDELKLPPAVTFDPENLNI